MTGIIKSGAGLIGGFLVMAFGSDDKNISWLYALLFLMALDFLMGIHDAKVKKTFCRRELLNGFYRKMIMLFMIVISHQVDVLHLIGEAEILQRGVTGYLMAYELVSIMSHITFAGVAVPTIFSQAINNFVSKSTTPTDNITVNKDDDKK